jgi:hypothetical protein
LTEHWEIGVTCDMADDAQTAAMDERHAIKVLLHP